MAQPIRLIRGLTTVVTTAGKSVLVNDGTFGTTGGLIVNPAHVEDQLIGSPIPAPLFLNVLGPAILPPNPPAGTIALQPGQEFLCPPLCIVWVNSQYDNHHFTAFFSSVYNPPPAQPVPPGPGLTIGAPGAFPPAGPTGLQTVIKSYLYQEYTDDDDCQGFVDAQNQMQQNYVDTFNNLNLPIYSKNPISGAVLDWVAWGLYGMRRPALTSGMPLIVGAINTWGYAGTQIEELGPTVELQVPAINQILKLTPYNINIISDDFYRRVLTWHLYKGDGKYFNIRWLKRRVWRFIYGVDGIGVESIPDFYPPNLSDDGAPYPQIADTEQISVGVGANRSVQIRFVLGERDVLGGTMLNRFGCNGIGPVAIADDDTTIDTSFPIALNQLVTSFEYFPPLPYMNEFQQALASGVLEIPAPWNFTVAVG
jgi:hypothetical protein